MYKFLGLVKNEYIKIFKKGSTFALIALMVIIVFGFEFILCSDKNKYEYSGSVDDSALYDYDDEIQWQKRTKDNHYEQKLELFEYIQSNHISRDSWRSTVLMRYADRNYSENEEFPQQTVEKLKSYVESNDWKGCYQYIITLPEYQDANDFIFECKYRIEHDVDPDGDDYKNDLVEQICQLNHTSKDIGKPVAQPKNIANRIAVLEYQLDNDIAYNVADYASINSNRSAINTWSVWSYSSSMVFVVAILMMIFAGNIVANEHSHGTIKFLLVNPVKRWKILLSKLFTVVSLSIVFMAAVFVICGACAAILSGTGGLKAAWLTVEDGVVIRSSALLFVVKQWLMQSVTLFVMLTFAFSLSTFARKSSIAIALSIVSLLIGSVVTQLLAQFGQDWGRFLIFANLDLNSIAAGETLFYRQSIGFAIFVIVEHIAVFLITAFDSFRKKSV